MHAKVRRNVSNRLSDLASVTGKGLRLLFQAHRFHQGCIPAAFAVVLLGCSATLMAQMSGHNLKGDFGLMSGTQPAAGFYFAPLYMHYNGDTLRNRNGDSIGIDPERKGSLDANAYSAGVWYVSDLKILGANYGFVVFVPFTDNKLAIPILELETRTDTGFTDLYFQPLNLGWHRERVDFTAGFGVFAPTGKYTFNAPDNLGLGMWSFELYGGTTVFLDEAKSWHVATTAFYETHTKKENTELKAGDILTLEGGVGKSFMNGALNVGAAYYAQWKVTHDELGLNIDLPERLLSKHRVFGIGPEATIPIATKTKLIALVTGRYLWESGARSMVEGQTFLVTVTFPIPSVDIP